MIAHPCQSNGRSTKQTKLCCFRGPHTSMYHTSVWLCTQLWTIGHLCGFHMLLIVQLAHSQMRRCATFCISMVCPVSSSWVNIMNEEAHKKAWTAGKDNFICVCGGTLLVSRAVSHGRCYLSCTCDIHMGLAMDVFRGHV